MFYLATTYTVGLMPFIYLGVLTFLLGIVCGLSIADNRDKKPVKATSPAKPKRTSSKSKK